MPSNSRISKPFRRLTRRQFNNQTLALVGASIFPFSESNSPGKKKELRGITGITKKLVFLSVPSSTPPGQTWRYGFAVPFQVAPRKGAIFCNVRSSYSPGGDWELGTDVVVFGRISDISAEAAIRLSRAHEEPNPNSKPPGKPAQILKYPVRGGFVPLGAKRADGSPHPHAGTGFGLLETLASPIYTRKDIESAIANRQDNLEPYGGAETYRGFELQQYAYDGDIFRVLGTERLSASQFLPGWEVAGHGLTNAIPNGDDLLFGLTCRSKSFGQGAGVSTWRRTGDRWRTVAFESVTGHDQSSEPSVIRDVDGELLFSARGANDNRNNLRVWRSRSGGAAWMEAINIRGIVSGPISINRTADGTPFVVSNLYQVFLYPLKEQWVTIIGPDMVRQGGWMRETLCAWPLNAERNNVDTPLVVRDSRAEFGPPPDGSYWIVDHPTGATIQLADGAWHSLLGYRIVTRGDTSVYGSDPTPQTGAYLEEVESMGSAIPSWNF